jgi:VWFA-related protein
MTIFRAANVRAGFYLHVFLLLVSLHVYTSPSSRAQDANAETDEVVRVRTDLVTVPVAVLDSRGRRVAGLAREAFELRDEGRVVELSYFAAGTDRVALTFLLDASGSAREIIARQRETALALFAQFGASSRVAVLHFRERTEFALPFTADLASARAAFDIRAGRDRRTAIFDAALEAVRRYDADERNQTERRIVILLSDGLDTASTVRAASVIEEARRRGVTFYVIHLPLFTPRDGRLVARQPTKGFREMAEQTGGQLFTVGDARTALDPRAAYDLAHVFHAIAEDLRGQYVLGYYAGEQERARLRHRFDVRLASQRGRDLRVRLLREGYVFKGDR